MGRCITLQGPPPAISIQLPGGAKVGSMASATQGLPNAMDPFQSLIEGVQPALSAIKPAFDIIGFVMALMDLLITIMKIMGALMSVYAPGNPLSILFPIDPMVDAAGDPIPVVPGTEEDGPYIPDFPGIIPSLLEGLLKLICFGLKLAALETHLSAAASIKDTMVTAMGFMDAAMAQVNSLTDGFASLPSADTGNSILDELAECAGDNSGFQLEGKLGPVGNLVPLMSIISLLADIMKQPLPQPVLVMAELVANPAPEGFGVIPFPDLTDVGGPTSEEQRDVFLGLIEDMTINGLPIEIPDFSDLSSIPDIMDDMKEKLGPILPIIELVQSVVDKITKC